MAKKKKEKRASFIFDDCGGGGCVAQPKTTRFKVQVAIPGAPGFSYTTQSKPCGTARETCPVQLFFKVGQPHLRFCRTQPKPSGGSVEAHVINPATGKPVKRKRDTKEFRRAPGRMGFTVPVNSADEARKLGAAACGCWQKSEDGFFETMNNLKKSKKTGEISAKLSQNWRGSFEKCAGVAGRPLGRLR